MTILDDHIGQWRGFEESHRTALRRCTPSEEIGHRAKALVAHRIVSLMQDYAELLRTTA